MRSFFDTNVLVYLFDAGASAKQAAARRLVQKEAAAGQLLLSTQVLQEFYVATTRKLAEPLSSEDAEQAMRNLATFPVVQVDIPLVIAGVETSRRLRISFWDALIVQSARQGGADVVYSEDLQHGQVMDGVRIVNPFSDKVA